MEKTNNAIVFLICLVIAFLGGFLLHSGTTITEHEENVSEDLCQDIADFKHEYDESKSRLVVGLYSVDSSVAVLLFGKAA